MNHKLPIVTCSLKIQCSLGESIQLCYTCELHHFLQQTQVNKQPIVSSLNNSNAASTKNVHYLASKHTLFVCSRRDIQAHELINASLHHGFIVILYYSYCFLLVYSPNSVQTAIYFTQKIFNLPGMQRTFTSSSYLYQLFATVCRVLHCGL